VIFHAYKTLLNLSQPIGPFAMPTTHTIRSQKEITKPSKITIFLHLLKCFSRIYYTIVNSVFLQYALSPYCM